MQDVLFPALISLSIPGEPFCLSQGSSLRDGDQNVSNTQEKEMIDTIQEWLQASPKEESNRQTNTTKENPELLRKSRQCWHE
jgi:hypothetical protein